MIVKIHHRKDHPAQVSRESILDPALNFRERGIMAYALVQRAGARVTIKMLVAAGTDGREAVQSAMHSLSEHGYADLVIARDAKGRLRGKEWHIYETKKLLTDERESRLSDR